MSPRIPLILAVAAVLILCRTAADQGRATVIRDSKSSNPPVEAGGHRLPSDHRSQVIPYSLIDVLRPAWCPAFTVLPWSLFRRFDWPRHEFAVPKFATPPDAGSLIRIPRPVP